jgi:hypothetical protein
MEGVVYILCALTSLICCVLLFRSYRANRMRLMLFSALCFAGLTLNNVILFLDLIVVTQIDLTLARNVAALLSVGILLVGLIWESE